MSKKRKVTSFSPQALVLDEQPSLHVKQSLNQKYGFVLVDNRMITHKRKVTFVFDYPLSGTFKFEATSPGGWSVAKAVRKIQQLYAQIYRRPGYYGVRNHGISDLVIGCIDVSADGRTISVGIDS